MIAAFIVVSSVVLALVFTIAWLTRPGFRQRIESPKHAFANQVRQYDRHCHDVKDNSGGPANESE